MKRLSFIFVAAAAFLMAAIISSCDDKDNNVSVTSVIFSKPAETLTVGSMFTLEYTVRPENAGNKEVKFVSDKPDVAEVSDDGKVTAKSVGKAEIAVITVDGNKRDYCNITVIKAAVPVTGVHLEPLSKTLNAVNEEFTLTANTIPADADNPLLEWESDKPEVATVAVVDGVPTVTAKTSGTANITVTTVEGGFTQTCVVTVDILVTGVTVRSSLSLETGETEVLTATVQPAQALERGVTWSIEPATGVAALTVNEDGTATVEAIGTGTAVITVTTVQGGLTAECNLTVTEPATEVAGADFSKAEIYNFSKGNGGTLYPEVFDVAAAARYVSMDLEHVFIVGRETLNPPFMLRLSDLKQGITSPIILNQEGVEGSYVRASGQLLHGRVYINNMTLGHTSHAFRIYHWDKTQPGVKPDVIGIFGDGGDAMPTTTIARIGDKVSYNIGETGTGYIFAPGNGVDQTLRIKVTNFTDLSEPTILNIARIGSFTTVYQVDGAQNEYLYSGNGGATRLIDSDGTTLYSMTSFGTPDISAARIVLFNGARYLVAMNKANTVKEIAVYDITKGATTKEALENLDNASGDAKAPVFTFSLESTSTDGAVDTHFVKDGDNKLYIVGSGQQGGFAIIELPAVAEN